MATPLLLSALIGLTMAQQSTVTLPFFGYDGDSFDASVIAAKPDATTFKLACPTASPDCGLFPYQTLTYGPSIYHMDMSVPGDGFTMTQDCKVASSSAVCVESASGSEANSPGKETATLTGDELGSALVTVTAGADKLDASAQATATTGSGVSPSASAGSAVKGTGAGVTGTPTPTPSSNAAARGVVVQGGLAAAAGLLVVLYL